jgi:peptidoglycan-associated lipoprotein
MPRKWSASALVVLALFVAVGCSKKAPVTPDPGPAVETDRVETPKESMEPKDSMVDPVERNPLDSEDLQEVNRALAERGYTHNVYFDFDKSDLRPEAREALARNAQMLREHGRMLVTIEGHCDERGTNEYNLALGERRAHTTRQYLQSLGVDGSRLTTVSYGEERPVCHSSDEGCWQQNRRAHMPITGNPRL